ncbi:MAG: DUF2807 domain-containing protein [Parvularculaceae bacterium]|nr:DUF2807 domain-containing protein [Parvularculaceae bacterium]
MNALQTLSALAVTTALSIATAHAETESYDLSGFDSVKASAGVNVVVEVGSSFSIELETEGDVDQAKVEVRGDTLYLSRQSRNGMRLNLGRSASYNFTVTMPSLSGASTSSGADMEVSGISGGDISLAASSGSDLVANGTCDTLTADASSGSDIKAFGLSCDNVEADVSSGADIEVTANSSLEADASSGGSVVVRGNPSERDIDRSSGGNVRFR